MSDLQQLTNNPVQVTNGSNGAHITVISGGINYSDSANSTAWHTLSGTILEVRPPMVLYMKALGGGGATAVVTVWSES